MGGFLEIEQGEVVQGQSLDDHPHDLRIGVGLDVQDAATPLRAIGVPDPPPSAQAGDLVAQGGGPIAEGRVRALGGHERAVGEEIHGALSAPPWPGSYR